MDQRNQHFGSTRCKRGSLSILDIGWPNPYFYGIIERAHSYKDKTARGIQANHGLSHTQF